MNKTTIKLFMNYETEKHVRFDEDEDADKKLGSLYMKKSLYDDLESPDVIKVTIEAKEG